MALAAMLPPLHAHHRVHSCFLPLAIASILFTAFCPWLMLKEPEQCVSVDSPCAVIPPPPLSTPPLEIRAPPWPSSTDDERRWNQASLPPVVAILIPLSYLNSNSPDERDRRCIDRLSIHLDGEIF